MQLLDSGFIRFYRLRLRLSQAELADVLGVDQSTVSRWEAGSVNPPLPVCRRLIRMTEGKTPVADARLKYMVTNSRALRGLYTLNFDILAVSTALADELHMTFDDIVGRNYLNLFTDDLWETLRFAQNEGLFSDEILAVEHGGPLRRLDGELSYHRSSWTLVHTSDNIPLLLWEGEMMDRATFRAKGFKDRRAVAATDLTGPVVL